jgi:hypothetical protein
VAPCVFQNGKCFAPDNFRGSSLYHRRNPRRRRIAANLQFSKASLLDESMSRFCSQFGLSDKHDEMRRLPSFQNRFETF